MNIKPQAQRFMHINITLLNGYNRFMRKDCVAFWTGQVQKFWGWRTPIISMPAGYIKTHAPVFSRTASILPFSCLVTVGGKWPVFQSPPTVLPLSAFSQYPWEATSDDVIWNEWVTTCMRIYCRYTMSFTLEGVVSMYPIQTITTKIFPACSSFLLWPPWC